MHSRVAELHRRLTGPEQGPPWLWGLRGLARGLSWLYGLAVGGINLAHDLELLKHKRLPVPVVGIGNLCAGGSGKTPLTMAVVKALEDLGLPAGVISRGYGGNAGGGVRVVSVGQGPTLSAAQAGDEPMLMASRLAAPLAVGSDRHLAGRVLLAACGPRVLVGDDLFQHRDLHRDLDILALPLDAPPDKDALLPRGNLREPLSGIRRARAIVLTHAEDPEETQRVRRWLRTYWGLGPVLSCRHRVTGLSAAGRALDPDAWRDRPVLAFCGLARPHAFERSLKHLGLSVCALQRFKDHHHYSAQDLDRLWSTAKEMGAQALVTSEKDLARLAALPPGPPLWATRLDLEFDGGDAALAGLLAWGLKNWRGGS